MTAAASASRRCEDLAAELAQLPGVRSAARTMKLPLRGAGDSCGIAVEGRPEHSPIHDRTSASSRRGYFETMGDHGARRARLHRCRPAEGERAASIVINEALAKKYFPGENPIGRRCRAGSAAWERIVGVVRERRRRRRSPTRPSRRGTMLADQVPFAPAGQTLVLRTDAAGRRGGAARGGARDDPARRARRRGAGGDDDGAHLGQGGRTGAADHDAAHAAAALALVLGAIGIYGVIAHFAAAASATGRSASRSGCRRRAW